MSIKLEVYLLFFSIIFILLISSFLLLLLDMEKCSLGLKLFYTCHFVFMWMIRTLVYEMVGSGWLPVNVECNSIFPIYEC